MQTPPDMHPDLVDLINNGESLIRDWGHNLITAQEVQDAWQYLMAVDGDGVQWSLATDPHPPTGYGFLAARPGQTPVVADYHTFALVKLPPQEDHPYGGPAPVTDLGQPDSFNPFEDDPWDERQPAAPTYSPPQFGDVYTEDNQEPYTPHVDPWETDTPTAQPARRALMTRKVPGKLSSTTGLFSDAFAHTGSVLSSRLGRFTRPILVVLLCAVVLLAVVYFGKPANNNAIPFGSGCEDSAQKVSGLASGSETSLLLGCLDQAGVGFVVVDANATSNPLQPAAAFNGTRDVSQLDTAVALGELDKTLGYADPTTPVVDVSSVTSDISGTDDASVQAIVERAVQVKLVPDVPTKSANTSQGYLVSALAALYDRSSTTPDTLSAPERLSTLGILAPSTYQADATVDRITWVTLTGRTLWLIQHPDKVPASARATTTTLATKSTLPTASASLPGVDVMNAVLVQLSSGDRTKVAAAVQNHGTDTQLLLATSQFNGLKTQNLSLSSGPALRTSSSTVVSTISVIDPSTNKAVQSGQATWVQTDGNVWILATFPTLS